MRKKIITITVSRGWKEGTRITFLKEGDQGPNKIPGNDRKEKGENKYRLISAYSRLHSLAMPSHIQVLFVKHFNMKLCLKNEWEGHNYYIAKIKIIARV